MLLTFFIVFYLCEEAVLFEINDSHLPKKIIYKLEDADRLFKEFTNEYKKNYSSEDIYNYRRKVFVDNLIKINRWNLEQPDAEFGIGPFTDMTFEEFTASYTGFHQNFTNVDAEKYEPKGIGRTAPESLDWRQSNIVTRVKDQKSCGSCYIFSAIGVIEGQFAKKTGQLIELSEQQSLDCNSSGCDGGFPHKVLQDLVHRGCMRESDYPYENEQRQCRSDPNKIVVRVTGGSQLYVSSEDDLKNALAQYGPLAVGIKTDPKMKDWRGGIFKPNSCYGGGHAVLLVGYGTDRGVPYWLMKNSWGPKWAGDGYLRLIRGQKACEIGSYIATGTVA